MGPDDILIKNQAFIGPIVLIIIQMLAWLSLSCDVQVGLKNLPRHSAVVQIREVADPDRAVGKTGNHF